MQYTFQQLKKAAKQENATLRPYRLAVVGDCSTQHVSTALKGYAHFCGIDLSVFDADYDQIDAQVMDDNSELYEFQPNAVLLYMASEKLYSAYCKTPVSERDGFAERTMGHIRALWQKLSSAGKMSILQFNFVRLDDAIFGNYAEKVSSSFLYQLDKLNLMMADGCQMQKSVLLIDLAGVQNQYGRIFTYDEKFYYIAKLPLSLNVLPAVAKRVIDVILSLLGQVKKCAVLDLDGTLWGGTIGGDGLGGIQIGELGAGRAFTDFQLWLKELKNRGILLAVCSKNDEDVAKEPFEKHPDMILSLDDFAIFVANWDDKAGNIRRIQKTLNIGFDSLVFFDDNPFERNVVRNLLPDVTVPELPEDPALYLSYIQGLNLFETISYSAADGARTKQYRQEAERVSLMETLSNYDEYLEGLDMRAVAEPFVPFQYPRIAQLTQRSNQFNLRTVRYTEAQIEQTANDENLITRYFTLRDKFGDYGLIGVVIMEKRSDKTLFVSTWLMSCRVLKRGMEEFIVNTIVESAKQAGCKRVVGEYIRTPKNKMVENIYERLGFTQDGDHFIADPDNFSWNKTHILPESGTEREQALSGTGK